MDVNSAGKQASLSLAIPGSVLVYNAEAVNIIINNLFLYHHTADTMRNSCDLLESKNTSHELCRLLIYK